jgi:hypothetical protein
MYLTATAINGSQHGVNLLSVAVLPSIVNITANIDYVGQEQVHEVVTGPPPDNLVVVLHRWVI